jgi:hypothetical protein
MTSTTPQASKLLSAARIGLNELQGISRRAVVTLCMCGALGIAGIYGASTVESDIPMTSAALFALLVGATITIVVGVGLMSLIFFSSRRGYDDALEVRTGKDRVDPTAPDR